MRHQASKKGGLALILLLIFLLLIAGNRIALLLLLLLLLLAHPFCILLLLLLVAGNRIALLPGWGRASQTLTVASWLSMENPLISMDYPRMIHGYHEISRDIQGCPWINSAKFEVSIT